MPYPEGMGTMEERRLGIYQASQATGLTTTKLYVAFARGLLPGKSEGGKVWFKKTDVLAYRAKLDVERAARERAAVVEQARRFRRANPPRGR